MYAMVALRGAQSDTGDAIGAAGKLRWQEATLATECWRFDSTIKSAVARRAKFKLNL